MAARLANALLNSGCAKGDRVAIMLSDTPELVVSFMACYKAGLGRSGSTPHRVPSCSTSSPNASPRSRSWRHRASPHARCRDGGRGSPSRPVRRGPAGRTRAMGRLHAPLLVRFLLGASAEELQLRPSAPRRHGSSFHRRHHRRFACLRTGVVVHPAACACLRIAAAGTPAI